MWSSSRGLATLIGAAVSPRGFLGAQNSGLSHLPQDSSELFVVCAVKSQYLNATFLTRAKKTENFDAYVLSLVQSAQNGKRTVQMLEAKQKLRTSLRDVVTSGHSVAHYGQVALLTFKSLVKKTKSVRSLSPRQQLFSSRWKEVERNSR